MGQPGLGFKIAMTTLGEWYSTAHSSKFGAEVRRFVDLNVSIGHI